MGGLLSTREFVGPGYGVFRLASQIGDTVCLGFGDELRLSPNHEIHVRPELACLDRSPAGSTQLGVVTAISYVCRACGCNAHNALCNRHGVTAPTVVRPFTVACDILDELAPEIVRGVSVRPELSEEVWLSRWPAAKRRLIATSLVEDDVQPTRGKSMIKREGHNSMPSKARLIQFYPNLTTQARFAPEFAALQKATCDVFNDREVRPGVFVTIASGFNAADYASWMTTARGRYADPWYYERDGKNWDATMQRPHHELKKRLYRCFSQPFAEFVESCFRVKFTCRTRTGNFRYTLGGTVKSGHNDTTLGNSINNACIAAEALVLLGLRGSILVAGDDLLIVIDGDFDEHALAGLEREFGIVPEYRKFHDHNHVSFVSGCWIGRDRLMFVPKLGRLLARLWWSVHPPSKKAYRNYRHSVVAGLLPTCGAIPLYREFLNSHDSGGDVIATSKSHHVVYGVAQPTCDDPLAAVCDRYGFTAQQVAELANVFVSLRGQHVFLSHPLVDIINGVDLADLADRVTT